MPRYPTRERFLAAMVAIACLAIAQTARADGLVFEIGGYGEMLYSHYNYGPDQKSDPAGSPPDSRAIVDLPRLVLELETFLTRELWMEMELEYEHGGTGSAMELEYEEFGEFEFESEKGGEVVIEEFYLARSFGGGLNARLGHFIVPVGLINRSHMPHDYFTAVRPESEVALIPTTWHETGAAIFGTVRGFSYEAQLVNGLDSSGFGSQNWVAGGHQARFEQAQATDLAVTGRLDYVGTSGVQVGVSGYYGNTTQNRPKPDMEGIDGHVTIGEAHAVVERGGLVARGMALYGTLENADLISQRNGQLPGALEVPRTPVAAAAMLWYVEAGYDVLALFRPQSDLRLYPFGRYEYYNSMEDVDAGVFADPRFERRLVTAGINLFVTPRIVLKADYSHRTFGDDQINDEDTVSIALGFSGTFFEHHADGDESPEEEKR
jgi:hypothetical protein